MSSLSARTLAAARSRYRKPIKWAWRRDLLSPLGQRLTAGDDQFCVPYWGLSTSDTAQHLVDPISKRGYTNIRLDSSTFHHASTPRGIGVLCDSTGLATTNDVPNIINGKTEFTLFAVLTPSAMAADNTIIGSWLASAEQLVFHFDNNSKIRFLVHDGSTFYGDWTTDTCSAGTEYRVAARLQSDGEMVVFINGSKNTVRAAGTTITTRTISNDLFIMNGGQGTNDEFQGTADYYHGTDIAVSDEDILAWTDDPWPAIRPALSKILPLYLVGTGPVGGAAFPHNPLGHPLTGPLGGPIGA